MNLKKTIDISKEYSWLPDADREVVIDKVDQLLKIIDAQPKSSSWSIRNKIGDRVKWYKEVHEVMQ